MDVYNFTDITELKPSTEQAGCEPGAVVADWAGLLEGRAPSRTCSEGAGYSGRRRKCTGLVPCKEWKQLQLCYMEGLRHGLSCLKVLGRTRTDWVPGWAWECLSELH